MEPLEIGGIDRYRILKTKVNQEEIFKSLGFEVKLDALVSNPHRENNTPSCFFKWYNGYLVFADFTAFFPKITMNCFDMYEFIMKKPFEIDSVQLLQEYEVKGINASKTQDKIAIKFKYSIWPTKHYLYDIPSRLLHLEGVFKVKEYACNTRRDTTMRINRFNNPVKELTIAYRLGLQKIKLYFVGNKDLRFYSNAGKEDVYGIKTLRKTKDKLIITKSGADFLCLKYVLNYDAIALNAEWPSVPISIINRIKEFKYDEIIILFDNDAPGIKSSLALKAFLEDYDLKVVVRYLPNMVNGEKCKDCKDLYYINKIRLKIIIKEIYDGKFYEPTTYEAVG